MAFLSSCHHRTVTYHFSFFSAYSPSFLHFISNRQLAQTPENKPIRFSGKEEWMSLYGDTGSSAVLFCDIHMTIEMCPSIVSSSCAKRCRDRCALKWERKRGDLGTAEALGLWWSSLIVVWHLRFRINCVAEWVLLLFFKMFCNSSIQKQF